MHTIQLPVGTIGHLMDTQYGAMVQWQKSVNGWRVLLAELKVSFNVLLIQTASNAYVVFSFRPVFPANWRFILKHVNISRHVFPYNSRCTLFGAPRRMHDQRPLSLLEEKSDFALRKK